MGRLKAVAINEPAHSCNGSDEDPMPCCEDVSEELKVDEITKASFDFSGSTNWITLTVIEITLFNLTPEVEVDQSEFQDYAPPLPDHDLLVEQQVFLI